MLSRPLVAALLFVPALAGCTLTTDPPTDPEASGSLDGSDGADVLTLAGVVRDATTGDPVADARITLTRELPSRVCRSVDALVELTTNATGAFGPVPVDGVEDGESAWLTVDATGRVPIAMHLEAPHFVLHGSVAHGSRALSFMDWDALIVDSVLFGHVTGRVDPHAVVLLAGEPRAPGFTSWNLDAASHPSGGFVHVTRANATGHYAFVDVAPGEYWHALTSRVDGAAARVLQPRVDAGGGSRLAWEPAASGADAADVTATVTAPDGSPVVNASFPVAEAVEGAPPVVVALATTNATGVAAFRVPSPGTFTTFLAAPMNGTGAWNGPRAFDVPAGGASLEWNARFMRNTGCGGSLTAPPP